MKIKLAILDSDRNYLNHVVNAFSIKFHDSIELYSFTNLSSALEELKPKRINILMADSSFDVDPDSLPADCGFAYLMDSPDISSYKGQRAICKYQKVDALYNFATDLYAESSSAAIGTGVSSELPLYVFTSASGGVGASVAAVGCAKHFVGSGRTTLYINLEKLGVPGLYLGGSGDFSMSDVIFSVKSKRTNLAIKLKSNVRQDMSGVYWYPEPKNPLNLQEISKDDIKGLFKALAQTGAFERVVVDINFGVDENCLTLFQMASTVVFVTDGSEIANEKFGRAYSLLTVLEKERNINLTSRVAVLYNKFSNKSGRQLDIHGLRAIGGIPKYENATSEQVIAQIVKLEGFASL